jgi:hypothetical protein
MSAVPPVHREVPVDADPSTAFEVFTSQINNWWPLSEKSVYGAEASVAFESGQIVERSAEGERAVWGTVAVWDPPAAVAFTWHPGKTADKASRVEVTFTPAETGTLVALEHTGWEVFDDPATARAEYDTGWTAVLGRYGAHARPHGAP